MQRSDTGFHVILAQFISGRSFFEKMESANDQVAVPLGAILHFQLDQRAIIGQSAGKTRRVKAKKREQGMTLWPVSFRMLAQKQRQSDALSAINHGGPILGSVVELGQTPGAAEQVAGPAESLLDGIFAGQERVGNFGNAETTKRLQNQCYLNFG